MAAFAPSVPLQSFARYTILPYHPTQTRPSSSVSKRESRAARWTSVSSPNATNTQWTEARDSSIIDDDTIWNVAGARMSKIVCTLGPKTCDLDTIEQLAQTGMDIVRLNMSHGTHDWHECVIANVRELNAGGRFNLGILLDTKGPEVRSGDLKAPLQVKRGDRFTWTIRKDRESFLPNTVDVSYDDFISDVKVGDTLLVDGGMSSFFVTEISETDVTSECIDGGTLTSRRHLNVRGKSASLPAITAKDWEDIQFGVRMNVDFYALSFVKHEDDVTRLVQYLRDEGSKALVLSKIESADAVGRLRPILEASDGAMVARGDLGAEIPIEDVPLIQDEIVAINRELRRPTIVATHMLESMITYPTPTRAEVTDITEAVRQGADATMLSGETANGAFPFEAITVMSTVAESVVSQDRALSQTEVFAPISNARKGSHKEPRVDLAYGASKLASRLNVTAILVFTRSGSYAKLVASTRPHCPIIAVSPDADLVRRLTLFWGIKPFQMDFSDNPEESISDAIDLLVQKRLACSGDTIVITSDMSSKGQGTIDTIQLRRVR